MMSFTSQPFASRLKLRLMTCVAFALLGVVAICLAFELFMPMISSHMVGFYMGSGCGLIAASVVTFIRTVLTMRDPEAYQRAERKESDERNLFLQSRAGYLSFWTVVVVAYVALLVSGLISELVTFTLLWVLAILLLIWVVVYTVCKRVY